MNTKSSVKQGRLCRVLRGVARGFVFSSLVSLSPLVTLPAAAQKAAGPASTLRAPQLVDITASTGIRFEHLSNPELKYIVESMGGGVALVDYDGDGWLDIYFTNAPSVAMVLEGKKARSALYHNNHDGTFTDVTDKAGVEGLESGTLFHSGATFFDYDRDGLVDLFLVNVGQYTTDIKRPVVNDRYTGPDKNQYYYYLSNPDAFAAHR